MAPSARYESEDVDAAPLGRPLKFEFSGKTAPNRFLKGAMTERLSSWDPKNLPARGIPSKELINVYRRWGEGGNGHILTGNIMIEYDHLEAAGNPIIPRDAEFSGERFEAFKEMATQGRKEGCLMVGQVSHPGRQVQDKIQRHPISASDVQLEAPMMGMTFAKPRAATEEDIANVIEGFAHAAEYLEKSGYDGIQLHGAHGYLLAQFLSPTTNQRTDKYGGSLENRARLILEIAQEVRKRTSSSFMVGIKLNSVEFQDKGFNAEEAKQLCQMLEAERFDFVELSGGTYESLAFVHKRESTKKREAFFMEFADAIAPALTKTKTYVTGGFKTVGAMVHALEIVDGVGLARPVCQEPHFCKDVLEGKIKGAIKQIPDQDNFGITTVAAGTQIKQIGKDQEPMDLSQQENADAFMKDMGDWAAKMAKDSEQSRYGRLVDMLRSTSPQFSVKLVVEGHQKDYCKLFRSDANGLEPEVDALYEVLGFGDIGALEMINDIEEMFEDIMQQSTSTRCRTSANGRLPPFVACNIYCRPPQRDSFTPTAPQVQDRFLRLTVSYANMVQGNFQNKGMFSLPAELRNRIYELVLPTDVFIKQQDHATKLTMQTPTAPSLTRVNQGLRQETLSLYYTGLTLRLDLRGSKRFECIAKCITVQGPAFALIKRIEFKDALTCHHRNYFVLERPTGSRRFTCMKMLRGGSGDGDFEECATASRDLSAVEPHLRRLNEKLAEDGSCAEELVAVMQILLWGRVY